MMGSWGLWLTLAFTMASSAWMTADMFFDFEASWRSRKMEAAKPRPRVDWQHVYAMEREIWGETFDHEGAPRPLPHDWEYVISHDWEYLPPHALGGGVSERPDGFYVRSR